MAGEVARDALAREEEMSWVRLLDGRLAWPHLGMAGFTGSGVVIHTEFILPNGERVTEDESHAKKRKAVKWPQPGEWWEVKSCEILHRDAYQRTGAFSWKDQLSLLGVKVRMKCGCFGPAFEPGALVGATGWQG